MPWCGWFHCATFPHILCVLCLWKGIADGSVTIAIGLEDQVFEAQADQRAQ